MFTIVGIKLISTNFKLTFMALGTVTLINEKPETGEVTLIDSTDVFAYNDSNFSSSGLAKGSPCTFDIDFTQQPPVATNLQPYTPTEKIITTPVDGPITIAQGETLVVKNGGVVKGDVVMNNSALRVEDNGAITGNITDNGGSEVTIRKGGNVTGNITMNSSSALKIVNKGVVKGNVIVSHADRLTIGNANGGGIVIGTITTKRVRRMEITPTSTINCG